MPYLLIVLLLYQTPYALAQAEKGANVRLVALLGGHEQVLQIHEALIDALTLTNPELARHQETIASWARQYITQEALEERLAAMYSQYFTDEELTQMIIFYGSDTGKKTVRLMPILLRETRAIGRDLAEEHKADLQRMLQSAD